MLEIFNVRLGFATNSSSSHSIVWMKSVPKHDRLIENAEFGFEVFVAASAQAKRQYLAQQLMIALRTSLDWDTANVVINELVGAKALKYGYVDHKSRIEFPKTFDGLFLDREFVTEFCKFVLDKNVVIIGGNDNQIHVPNDAIEIALRNAEKISPPLFLDLSDCDASSLVCRRDRDYWVMFNRRTGAKIRMRFSRKLSGTYYPKTPELVDIKITNACNCGCKWCYQDSRPNGVHGDSGFIERIIDSLEALKVFEVSFGGGDPTLHPCFWKLLQRCSMCHIVPSFSTRSTDWIRNPQKAQVVRECCGAIGLSIWATNYNETDDIKNFVQLANDAGLPDKLTIQFVVGNPDNVHSQDGTILRIVDAAAKYGATVLLLGFKAKGRAKGHVPIHNADWVNAVASADKGMVAIDTVLANEYSKELKKAEIAEILYAREEGKYSMYIDAVTRTAHKCSYEGEPIELESVLDDLKDKKKFIGYADALEWAFSKIQSNNDLTQKESSSNMALTKKRLSPCRSTKSKAHK